MLIGINEVIEALTMMKVKITGVLHVGAHRCEEASKYDQLLGRASNNDVLWIEGNPILAIEAKHKGFNVINAVVSDTEEEVTFNVASNGESSSILELSKHKDFYPHIVYVDKFKTNSRRLDTIIDKEHHYNFWNLDIQGVELKALKSAGSLLDKVDAIYTEVNVLELYAGCDKLVDMDAFLQSKGFIRLNTMIVGSGWGDALYVRKTM
jgi:FkbM family methyltransferase